MRWGRCENSTGKRFLHPQCRYEDIVSQSEVEEVLAEENREDEPENGGTSGKKKRTKVRVVYGPGSVYPQYFTNAPGAKRTIRIDTKMLKDAESEDPNKRKRQAVEELRRVVSTVGKQGQPGERFAAWFPWQC